MNQNKYLNNDKFYNILPINERNEECFKEN